MYLRLFLLQLNRWQSTAAACAPTRLRMLLFATLCLCMPQRIPAQEMEVPVSMQVSLFLKVMTFDRQRDQQPDSIMVVGLLFQSGYRASLTARDQAAKALRGIQDRKIRIVLIDIDHEQVAETLKSQHVDMLYVSPLRAINVATIASAAASAQVISVSGVPQYVEMGVAVSARLQGERPRLMVNLTASRLSGADFTAELLKLAEVSK